MTSKQATPIYKLAIAMADDGAVEFSEASKACALQFLEHFTSSEVLPSAEEPLPLRTNWPQVEPGELEGECLDIARRYLAARLAQCHLYCSLKPVYHWQGCRVGQTLGPQALSVIGSLILHGIHSFGVNHTCMHYIILAARAINTVCVSV